MDCVSDSIYEAYEQRGYHLSQVLEACFSNRRGGALRSLELDPFGQLDSPPSLDPSAAPCDHMDRDQHNSDHKQNPGNLDRDC
jgi:hypothetical protein